MWTMGLLVALGVAAPAWAQRSLGPFGGPGPNELIYQPINMSHAIPPPVVPQARRFSFGEMFSRLNLVNFFIPKTGMSVAPPPGVFPTTGVPSPIQPLPPVVPRR
jgi:hypothetical protein